MKKLKPSDKQFLDDLVRKTIASKPTPEKTTQEEHILLQAIGLYKECRYIGIDFYERKYWDWIKIIRHLGNYKMSD